jgi:hypothetical protein
MGKVYAQLNTVVGSASFAIVCVMWVYALGPQGSRQRLELGISRTALPSYHILSSLRRVV